jgi:hypothetical protein
LDDGPRVSPQSNGSGGQTPSKSSFDALLGALGGGALSTPAMAPTSAHKPKPLYSPQVDCPVDIDDIDAAKVTPARQSANLTPWRVGARVDVEAEDGTEYGATVLGPSRSGKPDELEIRFADGVVDDWSVADLRPIEDEDAPVRDPGAWAVGDVVDVETEDGVEYGATILGPSQNGNPQEQEVRFADGVVDDWSTCDFRRPGSAPEGGAKVRLDTATSPQLASVDLKRFVRSDDSAEELNADTKAAFAVLEAKIARMEAREAEQQGKATRLEKVEGLRAKRKSQAEVAR